MESELYNLLKEKANFLKCTTGDIMIIELPEYADMPAKGSSYFKPFSEISKETGIRIMILSNGEKVEIITKEPPPPPPKRRIVEDVGMF